MGDPPVGMTCPGDPNLLMHDGSATHRLVEGVWYPACMVCQTALLPGEFYIEVRRRDPADVDSDQRLGAHLRHFRAVDYVGAEPVEAF